MSFRRSSSDAPGSSRWRLQHRSELLACGVPEGVLGSDRSLSYVLIHGTKPLRGGCRELVGLGVLSGCVY